MECFKKKYLIIIFFINSVLLQAKFNFTSKGSTFALADATSYLILNRNIDNIDGTISLPDQASGRISGYRLIFSDGVLRDLSTNCDISTTGTYDLASSNSIILDNNDVLAVTNSTTLSKPITILSGATAVITGGPVFGGTTTLTDATSVLKMRISTPLNQNIVLNGGKVVLDTNLAMTSGTQITGTGTVDLNSNEFLLSTTNPFTATVTLLNAKWLSLSGNTSIGSQIIFQGTSQTSVLNGNGFMLDFAAGSSIKVQPQHTLYIVNARLRNFGPTGPSYGYFDIDSTSSIVLQNCSIELNGNYTHSSGTIMFTGDTSRLLTRGFSWTTSSGSAYLAVNNVALEYDNLDQTAPFPFAWTSEATQKLLTNNGHIRPTETLAPYNASATTTTIYKDYYLSAVSNLNFINATPATPKPMSLVGGGFNIFFPLSGSGTMVNIDPNVTLTTSNASLINFNKAMVNLKASTSSLVFGSGTSVFLPSNTTVAPADFIWNFNSGASQVIGSGTILALAGSKRISASNGAAVTLKNLTLTLTYSDSIACLDSSSSLIFENVTIALGVNGFYFDTGSISFKGNCNVQGGDPSSASNIPLFVFASTGSMTIGSASILRINRGLEFKYMANPANDGGLMTATKRHLVFTDLTSTLVLEGCTLHSTTTGLAIDQGRLVIEDSVSYLIDGVQGASAEIKASTTNLEIKAGGNLQVFGALIIN